MIRVTNTKTGEWLRIEGKLMVAPNGVVFIKHKGETVWASGSTDFVAEKETS